MLVRKERWGFSWRGPVPMLFFALVGAVAVRLAVHPLLAVAHREETNTLVVEGRIGSYGVDGAMQEFKRRSLRAGYYHRRGGEGRVCSTAA